MIRFFKKLFKRGDFMTRADKAYYKYRAKTIFWSAFCMIIIAWVGTNLVLCALTTDVKSNFDIGYEATEPVVLPTGTEMQLKFRQQCTGIQDSVRSVVFDKFSNGKVDIYLDENGNNLLEGANKTVLEADGGLYLYSHRGTGAETNHIYIYVLSKGYIFANEDSSYLFANMSGSMLSMSALILKNFNTSLVKNMSHLFDGSAIQNIDLSGLNTSSVTDMSYMFCNCSNLRDIKMTGWDTKNVTTMAGMFQNMAWDQGELYSLDLSSFDTRNVLNMQSMFNYTSDFYSGLQTIYASDRFVVDQVEQSKYMFGECKHLVGGQGTQCTGNSSMDIPLGPPGSTWEDETINKTYARIDGGPNSATAGYFTEKAYSGK